MMKIRCLVLLCLIFLSCGFCFGQIDFSISTLNATSTSCTTRNTSDHVVINTIGFGGATFTLDGTWSGSIGFFATGDGGTTWFPLNVMPSNSTTPVTTATGDGLWQANVSAYTNVCMLMTAQTAGMVFAKIHCSPVSARAGGGGGGTGGGGGPVPLSAVTSATSSPTALANGSFNIPWNWSLTGPGAGLAIGETAASTGGTLTTGINNQAILQLQTASNSTASPLLISQGTLTGTTATPAAQIQTTWNNAGLSGQGLVIQANCAACTAATSYPINVLNGSSTSLFSLNYNGSIVMSGNFTNTPSNMFTQKLTTATGVNGSGQTTNLIFSAGNDLAQAGVSGGGIFRGSDNSLNANAAAAGGYAIVRGGLLTSTAASAAAMQGATQFAEGYFATGIAAADDVVCATAVQLQVTDCPLGAVNIIGVANNATGVVTVTSYGTVPVRLSAAATAIGNIVCMSTTAVGQAVDSGSKTAACTTGGAQVGVIVATSGSVVVASGATTATVALSTTLPLVQLHIR